MPRPLADHLRTAPRRRWALALTLILLLAALILADRRGWFSAAAGDHSRYHGARLPVARVLTPDSLELAIPDGPAPATRVRLWGLTAPGPAPATTAPAARPVPAPADAALAFTRRLCEGLTVRLDLEPHTLRDTDHLLLAYVTLPDGSTLNERLLAAGLARADARRPHRHLQRYQLLEAQARHDRLGIWR